MPRRGNRKPRKPRVEIATAGEDVISRAANLNLHGMTPKQQATLTLRALRQTINTLRLRCHQQEVLLKACVSEGFNGSVTLTGEVLEDCSQHELLVQTEMPNGEIGQAKENEKPVAVTLVLVDPEEAKAHAAERDGQPTED